MAYLNLLAAVSEADVERLVLQREGLRWAGASFSPLPLGDRPAMRVGCRRFVNPWWVVLNEARGGAHLHPLPHLTLRNPGAANASARRSR
jgi:hypothetical protein